MPKAAQEKEELDLAVVNRLRAGAPDTTAKTIDIEYALSFPAKRKCQDERIRQGKRRRPRTGPGNAPKVAIICAVRLGRNDQGLFAYFNQAHRIRSRSLPDVARPQFWLLQSSDLSHFASI